MGGGGNIGGGDNGVSESGSNGISIRLN